MADVRIVCVREDLAVADQLAEVFETCDLSVADDPLEEASVTVLLWSEAAAQSRPFLRAASATLPDVTLIASLVPGAAHPSVFDLSKWDSCMQRALVRAATRLVSHADVEPMADIPLQPAPALEPRPEPPPRAPERIATGWREINPQPHRRIAIALAIGFIALIGVQFRPADTTQTPLEAVTAPVVVADATAYQPEDTGVVLEPADEDVAPPPYLLEPASAGAATPPPYRSWDHEEDAAEAEVQATTASASAPFEARAKRAVEIPVLAYDEVEQANLWQTASYRAP